MENIPTKVDGVDVLPADQWNQVPSEIENAILSTGITLSSGDLFQLGKTIANYAANGDFYTDSGAADAYVLNVIGSKQALTAYGNGSRARFIVGNTNTGASTVNVAALGVKSIKRSDGTALVAGDIATGELIEIEYNGTDFLLKKDIADVSSIRDLSRNLVIANDGGNPTFQLDITADEVMMQDTFGNSKRAASVVELVDITTSGAGGLDTGSEASDTWYFIWIIGKADGTIDGLLSVSSTAPTMPSGYTFKALTGVIYNDSGSDFITINKIDDRTTREIATALSGGVQETYTSVDLSAIVPTDAKVVRGYIVNDDNDAAAALFLAQDSSGFGELHFSIGIGGASSVAQQVYFEIDLKEAQTIYYKLGTTQTGSIFINGWK